MPKKSKLALEAIMTPARLGFLSYLGDTQGCGTIRVLHPYLLLNHWRRPDIQIMSQPMNQMVFDPEYYKTFTFCQFQRSATEDHFKLFVWFKTQVQKKYRIPVIYEIDDMLIDIPGYNYATQYYKKNEDWVKKCMEISDGMVTSTEQLKKDYSQYCQNIAVVPNHLPKFIWGSIFPAHEYKDESRKIKILWAGSQNHFSHGRLTAGSKGGDFGSELINYIKKTTHIYDWYFVGAMPEELNEVKDKLCFMPWKHIFEYPAAVKAIEPDIALAPLVDNPFNACKSNIKVLEFTACGAAGIYSDVEPYKRCNRKAKTDEEFIQHIEELAVDIDARAKTFKRDYNSVRQQLWWEDNNNVQKYIETYLSLFGKRLPNAKDKRKVLQKG